MTLSQKAGVSLEYLFENKQEFVDYLNSLYKLYYDEIE